MKWTSLLQLSRRRRSHATAFIFHYSQRQGMSEGSSRFKSSTRGIIISTIKQNIIVLLFRNFKCG